MIRMVKKNRIVMLVLAAAVLVVLTSGMASATTTYYYRGGNGVSESHYDSPSSYAQDRYSAGSLGVARLDFVSWHVS